MFRAFRYRNYRLFFIGQFVSLVGAWMTSAASGWLVYRLTGSAFLLGVVGFASQFPAFILAPLAGVYVDRWDKKKILITTQTLSMIQSFALAFAVFGDWCSYGVIVALNIFQGLVTAFDMPCRQSFVIRLVEEKEILGNAIALNSSMFNAARLLGPTLAGFVIAISNEGWCFFIDGVSYLAVLLSLFAIQLKPAVVEPSASEGLLDQLKEGWTYAFGYAPIRRIIILMALISLVGIPYSVLMPIMAKDVLKGGPDVMGFLMASSAAGSLCGALWLANRKNAGGLEHLIPFATVSFGLGLIAFSQSRIQWVSMIFLVIVGAGFMIQMASSNTILQTIVDDNKRGRVMSLFIMAFMGASPAGAVLTGSIADLIGPTKTLVISGCLCLVSAIWFSFSAFGGILLQQIYRLLRRS